MNRIICKSGTEGWEATIQENWSDFETFEHYCEIYGFAERFGFSSYTPASIIWDMNPLVCGSTVPEDLCISPNWKPPIITKQDFAKFAPVAQLDRASDF